MDTQQANDNRTVYEFITNNPCGTIATHGDEGRINLANVFAYVDNNFFLYIVTRPDHRKSLNIKEHPQTSLIFTDQNDVTQVEVIGVGKPVDETESVAELLPNIQEVLTRHKSAYWVPPVSQIEGENYAVVKIVPESITYRSYAKDGTEPALKEISVLLEGSL